MARINLLPWRVERRKQRHKEFLGMLGLTAIGAVLVSFLIISYYKGQISGENDRNAFLRDQIAKVDQQIIEIEELDRKKAKLLARKEVIEQLQANRSQMVHLFDSLVRTIPDGVTLSTIKQDGNILTLSGRSQSNARVSTYMRTLEGSGWMTKPDLSIIEAKAGEPGLPYTFTLSVQLNNPNGPKDTDGDGIPDAPAVEVPAADATANMAPASTTAPAGTDTSASPNPASGPPPAADTPTNTAAPASTNPPAAPAVKTPASSGAAASPAPAAPASMSAATQQGGDEW